jgi:hypothetical protein
MPQSLTHRRRRFVVIVLFIALAAMPWTASAAPNRTSRVGVNWAPADVLGTLKGWLRNLWADNGCIIDPNGRCLQGTTNNRPTTDAGCIIDPDGKCKAGQ